MKVVVTSDNLVTRSIMRQSLSVLTRDVVAVNPDEAWDALRWDSRVAVVVLDLHGRDVLPVEIAGALVRRVADSPVYVIALCSSRRRCELMQVVPGRGVFSVLPKPIDLRALATHVRVGLRLAANPDLVAVDHRDARRAIAAVAMAPPPAKEATPVGAVHRLSA